ncbi:MAG: DUF1178 family protein [Rhodospirillaceae bacterium]
MILFNLRCADGHGFEAWFKDGAAWEEQRRAGVAECPVCGSTDVSKAPMAPRIARSRGSSDTGRPGTGRHEVESHEAGGNDSGGADDEAARRAKGEVLRQLNSLCRVVEQNCDYVGDRFAEEARRIHYGESKPRDIYGEASKEQATELHEEGVVFQQLPWLPRTNS